jgi:hypothetical protein
MNMTNKEAVLLSNPSARLNIYGAPGERQGFWVSGPNLETKVTYSEERAWQLAYVRTVGNLRPHADSYHTCSSCRKSESACSCEEVGTAVTR